MHEKSGSQNVANTGFGIASALLTAFGITIPGMLILAAILTFTDFPEKYTALGVLLATLTGLFIAGYKTGTRNEKTGMVKGGLSGLAYMLVLYLVSSIVFKYFTMTQRSIIMTVTGIVAGLIGGLMGMNKKPKTFSRLSKIGKGTDLYKKYRK